MVFARGEDAIGAVGTGFSKVYAAKYGTVETETNKNVTTKKINYTGGMRIAHGVGVDMSVEGGDSNDWYADNVVSESDGGTFQSGTVTYTLDDPFPEADALLHAREAAETINGISVIGSGGESVDGYLGTGYVREYKCNGTKIYRAIMLPKVKFQERGDSAQTREGTVSYQTITEVATISRDDTDKQRWCYKGANYYTTEAEAEQEVKTFLNIA
jgi:hypothetical protein